MYYLIGTDEAGYGPNLGPLAVTATLWKIQDDTLNPEMLFDALAPVVRASAGRSCDKGIPIADSKKLHRHETLQPLETGIFVALHALNNTQETSFTMPISTTKLCDTLCGTETSAERLAVPWHTEQTEEMLPKDISNSRVSELGREFSQIMTERGIMLLGIRSTLVFPARFNAGVESCNSKGVFLSDTTMRLIVHFWKSVQHQESITENLSEPPEVRVFCDKHGGRNFYLPTLMEFFPELPFCVVEEGRAFSEYIHYGQPATLRIRFQAKGEALLPVALASMVSKYLREISMLRFNRWWQQQIPGILPTAGYPLDAKRFRGEITEKMEELEIDWHSIWRNR